MTIGQSYNAQVVEIDKEAYQILGEQGLVKVQHLHSDQKVLVRLIEVANEKQADESLRGVN